MKRYITGWFNYYQYTYRHAPSWFDTVDQFMRRRIRAMIWTQLKSPQKRRAEVLKYAPYKMDKIGYSGRHIHVLSSKTLNEVYRNEVLLEKGYMWFSIANELCKERRAKEAEKSKTIKKSRRAKRSTYKRGIGLLPRPYALTKLRDRVSDDEIMKTLNAVEDMANYFVNEFLYM